MMYRGFSDDRMGKKVHDGGGRGAKGAWNFLSPGFVAKKNRKTNKKTYLEPKNLLVHQFMNLYMKNHQ